MTNNRPLNARQLQFCRLYVSSGNASESYRRAGYSVNQAHVDSSKLLTKPSIQAEVARLRELQVTETAVDRAYVVSRLRHIAEYGEKETNRLRATELLGKSVGLFVEQVEAHVTHDVQALREYSSEQLEAMLVSAKQQPVIESELAVLDG